MFSKMVFIGLCCLIVFSPIVFIGGTILSLTLFYIFILLLLGLLFFGANCSTIKFSGTFLDFFIVIYFSLACLSILSSKFPYNTRNELFSLSAYIIIFYLIIFITDEKKDKNNLIVNNFINFIIGTGIVISFYGIIKFVKINALSSIMMNANILAGYLLMIIPLVIGRICLQINNNLNNKSHSKANFFKKLTSITCYIDNKVLFFLYVISLSIMIICLIFTYSLGAWIGLICGLNLFCFLAFSKDRYDKLRYIIISVWILMVCLIINKFVYQDAVFNRFNWWWGALKMMFDYPLTGVGLGAFGNVYLKYKIGHLNSFYAHNYFFQIGSELGIVGLTSFLILIVCFFEKGIKAVLNYKKSLQQCVVNPISEDVKEGLSNQRDDVSRQKFFLNIAILSSLMGILVQNIFDYNLYIPVNAILFWILLALSCSFQNTVKRWEFSLDNTSRWWCKIVVMVVLLNLIIVVGRPFLASRYYVVGETFIENKNFNEAEKAFKKSIKLDHFWPYAYFGLAKTYVGNNKEGNAANKIKYAEAVVEIKKAINYDKYNAFFYYNLAYFYVMMSDNKKAEESINKAILYHYYKAEYHKFLADIYKNQGMNEKAEYEFALSEELINKYP